MFMKEGEGEEEGGGCAACLVQIYAYLHMSSVKRLGVVLAYKS